MPPPDPPSTCDAAAAASTPAAGEGLAWKVIATPYTGETHARGLAARIPLPRGTPIEVAPCLPITADEYAAHGRGVRALACYAFTDRAGEKGGYLLALGCGSLFNHSRMPNVDYRIDSPAATIRFFAARDIAPGEELTISYGRVWWEEGGGGGGGGGDARRPGAPAAPAHDHMDDEAGFLGAIGLGDGDGD